MCDCDDIVGILWVKCDDYNNLLFGQLDQLLIHFSLVRSRRSKRVRVRVKFWKYAGEYLGIYDNHPHGRVRKWILRFRMQAYTHAHENIRTQ